MNLKSPRWTYNLRGFLHSSTVLSVMRGTRTILLSMKN